MDARYLGVDLGGTQLRMAAVTPSGSLASEIFTRPTGRAFSADDLARTLAELSSQTQQALGGAKIAALGFGTAGVVTDGPLSQCDNLPLLNGTPIAALVRGAVPFPVALENDARCFTLAEARFGAARGAHDVVGITLGTGIGCGLMLSGILRRGASAQAGEVWKVPLRGRHLEHFVSGAGVVSAYEAAGGQSGVDAARIEERALRGEAAAQQAWRSFGEDLAFALSWAISLVDPQVIVLGGSLARARALYMPVLAVRLEAHHSRIVAAELGTAAGVVGAAALNIP
jgi:glucokinase